MLKKENVVKLIIINNKKRMIHNRKQITAIITIDTVLILVGLLVVVEEGLGLSGEPLCLSLSSI